MAQQPVEKPADLLLPDSTRGANFRCTASGAMGRMLHRACRARGLLEQAIIRWLWPASRARPGAASHTTPSPMSSVHHPGDLLPLFLPSWARTRWQVRMPTLSAHLPHSPSIFSGTSQCGRRPSQQAFLDSACASH